MDISLGDDPYEYSFGFPTLYVKIPYENKAVRIFKSQFGQIIAVFAI